MNGYARVNGLKLYYKFTGRVSRWSCCMAASARWRERAA
jgi:hypothetical protein